MCRGEDQGHSDAVVALRQSYFELSGNPSNEKIQNTTSSQKPAYCLAVNKIKQKACEVSEVRKAMLSSLLKEYSQSGRPDPLPVPRRELTIFRQ